MRVSIIFILFFQFLFVSSKDNEVFFTSLEELPEIPDSAIHELTINKQIDIVDSVLCYYVLQFFPELKYVPIVFKYGNLKTTMAARPVISSLFRSKHKRKYAVVINNNPHRSLYAMDYNTMSINAKIGILAHELSHILDYLDRSGTQMMAFGWRYAFNDQFKEKIEKKTDKEVINRGLKNQIFALSAYFHNLPDKKYRELKKYKRKFYLKPRDIISENGE